MRLSILISSYNMAGKIDRCLSSIFTLFSKGLEFEVVIVDSSNDNSMEIYRKWMAIVDNLKVIHLAKQTKCGEARNIAFQNSSGEYIYIMDIDDKLHDADTLAKMMQSINGKDYYFCPYHLMKEDNDVFLKPKNKYELAKCPVAVWTKAYKRELYVPFPKYMPEDVMQHYFVVDQAQSYSFLDFIVYDYDNTPQNTGAISRTYDWCLAHPCNMMQLANDDILPRLHLRDEYVSGVLHNLADMYLYRNEIKSPEVKRAYMEKLGREYSNFMAGVYVH